MPPVPAVAAKNLYCSNAGMPYPVLQGGVWPPIGVVPLAPDSPNDMLYGHSIQLRVPPPPQTIDLIRSLETQQLL